MARAYRYWNNANIRVTFRWSTNLAKSTYVTRTGGLSGDALATTDYPAQPNGYQRVVDVWDSMLNQEWQAVGPNILSHELGHALGLQHNDATSDFYELWRGTGDSIMGSIVELGTNVITAIPIRDRDGASILYNDFNPPKTNGKTVAILRTPYGPNLTSPPSRPKCAWSILGFCIYYSSL